MLTARPPKPSIKTGSFISYFSSISLPKSKTAFCEVQEADRRKLTEKYLDVSELGVKIGRTDRLVDSVRTVMKFRTL